MYSHKAGVRCVYVFVGFVCASDEKYAFFISNVLNLPIMQISTIFIFA